MQKQFNLYFLLIIAVMLAACGQGNRERSKIPPSPFQLESVMNKEAIDALTEAIRSNPSVAENYFKRASVFLKTGNSERALEDINRADQLKQNTGKYLFVKALILRKMKKYSEAFSFAQSAEILNIDTPELYTLLGDLSQQKNDLASAEKYLAKSLQIAPYDGETYFYKGTLAARKGDTISAISLINQSVEMKPSFREGYSKLTEILQNYRMYDSALVVNRSAIAQFPNSAADLYVERGLVYFKVGRLDSALVNYERAASIDNKRTDVLLYSAAIYYRWKSYEKALETYERVLEINEATPKVDYFIGLTQEQLGNMQKAEDALKEAVEKNPNDEQAIIALNRVSGRVNADYGNYQPAPAPVRRPTPAAPKPVVVEEPKKLLDTSRLRINTIKPKAKVNVKTDSTRKIGF